MSKFEFGRFADLRDEGVRLYSASNGDEEKERSVGRAISTRKNEILTYLFALRLN